MLFRVCAGVGPLVFRPLHSGRNIMDETSRCGILREFQGPHIKASNIDDGTSERVPLF
jgi:hypothetical protein